MLNKKLKQNKQGHKQQAEKQEKPIFNYNLNNDLESFIKLNANAESAAIWRANQTHTLGFKETPKLDTGFKILNQLLAFRGWPLDGINELNLEQHGIGELRLLIPALQTLKAQNILLIAPPFLPFAPALAQYGFQIEHWLVAQTDSIQDRLWAAEQALLSDTCAAVLCWTGRHKLSHKELRRLQLASKKSNSWFVLLRHQDCLQAPSPASLRLHLKTNSYGQLAIKIIKQTSGSAGQNCSLSLIPHYENWQRLPVHLWPQNNSQKTIKPANKQQALRQPKKASKAGSLSLINNTKVFVISPLSKLQNVH